jgi:hypothetical protein
MVLPELEEQEAEGPGVASPMDPSLDAANAALEQEAASPISPDEGEELRMGPSGSSMNIMQQDAPGAGYLPIGNFRMASVMRGMSSEEQAQYITDQFKASGYPQLTAGVDPTSGQVWYGDPKKDELYALDPNTWSDVPRDIIEQTPNILRAAVQVPMQTTGVGRLGQMAAGGAISAGTELAMSPFAERTLGPEKGGDDYTNMALEVGVNTLGAGLLPAKQIQMAKTTGEYLKTIPGSIGKKARSIVASAVQRAGKVAAALISPSPEGMFKVLHPKLSTLIGTRYSEAEAMEAVPWVFKHLPEAFDGMNVEQVVKSLDRIGNDVGAALPELYDTIDRNNLLPKPTWRNIKSAFKALSDIAESDKSYVTPSMKREAQLRLMSIEKNFSHAPSSLGAGSDESWSLGRLWAEKRKLNDAIKWGANGKPAVQGFDKVLDTLTAQGYANAINNQVTDDVFKEAVKRNPIVLKDLGHWAKVVSERTGDGLLSSANTAFHYLATLSPVVNRSQAVQFIKDNITGGGVAQGIKTAATLGSTMLGTQLGGPKVGILTGAIKGIYDITTSTRGKLWLRASQRGLMSPAVEASLQRGADSVLSTKAGELVTRNVEGLTDLLLTNPAVINWAEKGFRGGIVGALEEYENAPQPKKQKMLEELTRIAPEAFQQEPNKVKPEEKGAYDTRIMESVLNRKIGAVEGYKAHQKIVKDGTVANGNW